MNVLTKFVFDVLFLFAVVDAFDAGGDGGEDFVGDGAEDVGEALKRSLRSEDLDGVSDLAVYACHIDHACVHTYVAYRRGFFAIDDD